MYEDLKKQRTATGSKSNTSTSGSGSKKEAQAQVSETAHKLRKESSYTQGVDVHSPQFKKFRDQLELIQDQDQLNTEKGRGRILKGFKEGEILFPPTFKYDKRSARFDSSKKARCPAWTDRILYSCSGERNGSVGGSGRNKTIHDAQVPKNATASVNGSTSLEGQAVNTRRPLLVLNSYGSLDVRSSDHRPVYASFTINV